MFETFVTLLSTLLKPLLDVTRDAFQRSSDPKSRMSRTLIRLYDRLGELQHISYKLLDQTEEYIAKESVAWTAARNRRAKLVETADQLARATGELGHSLRDLYSMLSVHQPELLLGLVSLYGPKGDLIERGIASPSIVDASDDPKKGHLKLIHLTGDPSKIGLDSFLISESGRRRFRPVTIEGNILTTIDIDEERERVLALIEQSRPVLAQIDQTKEALREFIKHTVSIEDFFR
jgi:hypothetical protein